MTMIAAVTTAQIAIVCLSAVVIVAIVAFMKWRIEVDEHASRAQQAHEGLLATAERHRVDTEAETLRRDRET